MSDILQPGPELDALVSEAMGKPVVGWATITAGGIILTADNPEGERRPVYLKECLCATTQKARLLRNEPKLNGHYVYCLAPVERYSESWDMAGELVEFLRDLKVSLELNNWVGPPDFPYNATLLHLDIHSPGHEHLAYELGTTGPHAISLAFVEAAKLLANKEENK